MEAAENGGAPTGPAAVAGVAVVLRADPAGIEYTSGQLAEVSERGEVQVARVSVAVRKADSAATDGVHPAGLQVLSMSPFGTAESRVNARTAELDRGLYVLPVSPFVTAESRVNAWTAELDHGLYILPADLFVPTPARDGAIVRAGDARLDNGFYILPVSPFATAMSEVIAKSVIGDNGLFILPCDGALAGDPPRQRLALLTCGGHPASCTGEFRPITV